MNKRKDIPKVVEKTESEVAEIIRTIRESALPENMKDFVIKCVELALWLPLQLQNKKISLSRLRKLIFGKGYKKNKNSKYDDSEDDEPKNKASSKSDEKNQTPPDNPQSSSADADEAVPANQSQDSNQNLLEANNNNKKQGHGRMSHTVYEDFTQVNLKVIDFQIGDPCPMLCSGKLRAYRPGILVRITGQNFADVHKYIVEKLRCSLCGYLISASIGDEVGNEKYAPSFKSILTLQKYYVAVPFYRQEYFQRLINFPLPDATQWDLIEQVAGSCYPIYNLLIKLAANGKLIHNDDTTVRILEVIKEIKSNPELERTGMYTTGCIAEYEEHQIALFINSRQHAGENLDDILQYRQEAKPPIMQMCDALSNNIAKKFKTILCNCLGHGFRKFEEIVEYFPDECLKIMKLLGEIYENDAKTKGMTDKERLSFHQKHSQPIADQLKCYIDKLLNEGLVEPNSALGKALKYMRKHWPKLTKFLTVAGAPIDNNVVERALKIAIRNRKAAMFYRSCYSASIGGMLTSIIYTCHLANQNAHHYLTILQQHKKEVLLLAQEWLPWNYQQTLAIKGDANALARPPPEGYPAVA